MALEEFFQNQSTLEDEKLRLPRNLRKHLHVEGASSPRSTVSSLALTGLCLVKQQYYIQSNNTSSEK
jgi:hypothetical protein